MNNIQNLAINVVSEIKTSNWRSGEANCANGYNDAKQMKKKTKIF